MFLTVLLAITMPQSAGPPPVPGLCSAPVPADRNAAGCYKTGELDLSDAPTVVYWHIHEADSLEAATAEARRHRWAAVAQAHGRTWLYVMGAATQEIGPTRRAHAVIGPLSRHAGPVTAHFAQAVFPPGMRTRVHSHPGPEAFYVVEGEQCMETPTDQARVQAGGSYIVERGPHIQAAPTGRRNLVLILAPTGEPFVIAGSNTWTPTAFCDR